MMQTKTTSRERLWLAAVSLAALVATDLCAEPPTAHQFTPSMRTIAQPGAGGASSAFENYSYGLGGLNRYRAPDTNVLSSSVMDRGSYDRPRLESLPGAEQSGLAAPKGNVYSTFVPNVPEMTADGSFTESIVSNHVAAGMARIYLDAVGTTLGKAKADQGEPITSLIPSAPSQYATLIADGERLFRTGDYDSAFNKFQLANYIGGHDPDSLLSMAHASFAAARFAYGRPAYYLRQTLTYLPELPLLPLKPKEFYAEPAKFVEQEIRLEEHVRQYPQDPDANLVMAYVCWFSDNPDGVQKAKDALARALSAPQISPDTVEAVETFYAGMLASGRVTGKLVPPAPGAQAPQVAASAPASAPVAKP